MSTPYTRKTTRYALIIVIALAFLFFTNDFGLTDVQKTAIVLAVGIDREEDTFIVTSQIAVPQSSKQGDATQNVQLVSRGKTIAEALEQINAKTGWYPKLVFCKLIILGEKTAQSNVFDALDYFLLDEYLSDSCLVATCDGLAKDLLNVTAVIDPSSSLAIIKILSSHAQRVGTVLPATLREFAISFFGDSKSGFLPILKTEPQQETIGGEQQPTPSTPTATKNSAQNSEEKAQNPVFSARETALFVDGKRVGKLSAEETFAFNAVKNDLRLAAYSVNRDGGVCSLSIKQNAPKRKLTVGKEGNAVFHVNLSLTAGLLDASKSLPLDNLSDGGDVPDGVFSAAQKKLSAEIYSLFEKTKALGCDLFGIREQLVKFKSRDLHRFQTTLLANTTLSVRVTFKTVR